MSTPKESLFSLHQLLHLTHHRNKNQHRLSKWYKPFSILRRQISKLISELETLETAELYASKEERLRENKYVMAAREKVEARVKFLREYVLENCFWAFSNLVADNQYSALGLVLLGCLARVKSVIGMLVEDEGMDGVTETGVGEEESVMREVEVKDDFGEVVSRKEILGDIDESLIEVNEEGDDAKEQSGGQVEQETTDESQHITMARSRKKKGPSPLTDRDKRPGNEISTPSKPPKKKRKKGDAFDDLFSSLI